MRKFKPAHEVLVAKIKGIKYPDVEEEDYQKLVVLTQVLNGMIIPNSGVDWAIKELSRKRYKSLLLENCIKKLKKRQEALPKPEPLSGQDDLVEARKKKKKKEPSIHDAEIRNGF